MLEKTMRMWWFKSLVESRCRPGSELEGVLDREALRQDLENSYQGYMKKYGDVSLDSRRKMHVSCACLVLATHASLSPLVRGHNADERILSIIQEHHGSKSKPLLQCVDHITLVLLLLILQGFKSTAQDGAQVDIHLNKLQGHAAAPEVYTNGLWRGHSRLGVCFYTQMRRPYVYFTNTHVPV